MQMWGTMAVPFSPGEEEWSIWDYDKAISPQFDLDFLAVRNMAEEQAELPTEDQEMESDEQTSAKENDSNEEESDEEEYFEVEKITARKKRNGVFQYRVRWKGYPPSNDTWEPVDNLSVVEDMVEEFDAKEDEKNRARQEERRLRKLRMEGKRLPGEESSDSSDSSDDERLLSEDTKFFKMLEKNKDIVFGQPDLYSKVKSRAASLANKKKVEESQKESTRPGPKPSRAQPARVGSKLQKTKVKEKPHHRKSTSKGEKQLKKSASKDSEESDYSPARRKVKGKSRGRPKKTLSSEDAGSDNSVSKPIQRQGRPRKQSIVDNSDSDKSDSEDLSTVRASSKRSIGQRKALRIESSEESVSDHATVGKRLSQSVKSTDKQPPKKLTVTKKTPAQKRPPSPVSERESEDSSSQSDDEEPTKSEPKPTTEIKSPDTKKDSAASPIAEKHKTEEKNSSKCSDSTSTLKSSMSSQIQSRVIVPVLEKFAFSSTHVKLGDVKEGVKDDRTLTSCRDKSRDTEKKTVHKKDTTAAESMETDAVVNKDERKESKSKSSSRKRKLDTAADHEQAVKEGAASPIKSSPVSSPRHTELQSPGTESDPPVLSRESRTYEIVPNDDTTAHCLPPVLQKNTEEKKVPPLRICVPKLKTTPPKLTVESCKPYPHHSPKSHSVSSKPEKVKLKGDGGKSSRHEHHTSSTTKTSQACKRPSVDDMSESAPGVTFLSSVAAAGATSSKKDSSRCSSHQTHTGKSDLKAGKVVASESAAVKQDSVKTAKTDCGDRISPPDVKVAKPGLVEVKKKQLSASCELSGSVSGGLSPGGVKSLSSPSKDFPPPPAPRPTATLPSTSTPSTLYPAVRDTSTAARSGGYTSAASRDFTHTSPSFKDMSGSSHPGSSGDVRLGAGYIHLSSSSSRDTMFSHGRDLLSPRGESKESCAGGSRHSLNSSISGKENADRHHVKALSSMPKKGDLIQPLDTILNSALYGMDTDKSRQYKGLDSDFDIALQRIDLEYLEKLLLPPVTPMELSDEELRQAVIDGNCYLVERALACNKAYNLNLPDNKGNTLLMNAVLRGSDDIIVHLLSGGADAQVQVNGVTALMLAVEHAESSTVFMLLEMGAHVNTADHNGETALFKAVRRGDKQVLKLILDHGANFSLLSRQGLSPLQTAKQFRLADVETTLLDHIQRVVRSFEEQVNLTVGGTAKLVSCLFPHHCVPLYESDTITIPFKYQPSMPTGPGMGCLLFIAHARFNQQDVKCRLYGQCAVETVTLNGVLQPCLTEESNFVLMCHPLITGWNELVIHTKRDAMSKAKLIVCAYKAQLIYK